MACILKTLDFIYSLYSYKAKQSLYDFMKECSDIYS